MAVTNLGQFNREMRNFSKKLLPHEFLLFQKKIALHALKAIVLRTPVDTGRARGNWQVAIDEVPKDILETEDKSGDAAISTGTSVINAMEKNRLSVVYIANSLPYIEVLENGHSQQAPQGMVDLTFAELREVFP